MLSVLIAAGLVIISSSFQWMELGNIFFFTLKKKFIMNCTFPIQTQDFYKVVFYHIGIKSASPFSLAKNTIPSAATCHSFALSEGTHTTTSEE